MKKFILFFVLSFLLISFGAFLINAYQLQKNYFDSKTKTIEENKTEDTTQIVSKAAYYKDYSKTDYDLALNEKSVLVLYFTSNWCKECISQDALIAELFNKLEKTGVVGLKIHILDSETTIETDLLAKKFDVTKENTLIILNKDGSVAYKYVGTIDKELLKAKIIEATVR